MQFPVPETFKAGQELTPRFVTAQEVWLALHTSGLLALPVPLEISHRLVATLLAPGINEAVDPVGSHMITWI